jgi:hypothetical protein
MQVKNIIVIGLSARRIKAVSRLLGELLPDFPVAHISSRSHF